MLDINTNFPLMSFKVKSKALNLLFKILCLNVAAAPYQSLSKIIVLTLPFLNGSNFKGINICLKMTDFLS